MNNLTSSSHGSAATRETAAKIESFRHLPLGWHYAEGTPATPAAATQAIELLGYAAARGFLTTDAFPGIEGQVMLTVYEGPHYLEFLIGSDGDVEFVREEEGQEAGDIETLTLEESKAEIDRLREKVWPSSVRSTSNTGIIATTNLSGWPFPIWERVPNAAYQRSTLTALSNVAAASALILATTIATLPETRLVTGSSPATPSPHTPTRNGE